MKIHVKNTACSYWNLSNLFSDCEQFQPIFGIPLWPDHSLQRNLWWHYNIWTFHHCPPQFSAEPGLVSLCPRRLQPPPTSTDWSRYTSLQFALGHIDIQLEELVKEIWWDAARITYCVCMAVSQKPVSRTHWAVARVPLCAPELQWHVKVWAHTQQLGLVGIHPSIFRYLTVTVTAWDRFWSNEMLLGFLLIFNGDSYFLKHLR